MADSGGGDVVGGGGGGGTEFGQKVGGSKPMQELKMIQELQLQILLKS